MRGRNLILLIAAAVLLLSFTKKKKRRGSIEIGPLESDQLKARAGAILYQDPGAIIPIYVFKGDEWLQKIKEMANSFLVETVLPGGQIVKGIILKTGIK